MSNTQHRKGAVAPAKKEMLKQELYGTFALLDPTLKAMERLLSAHEETVGDIIERWTKTGEVDVPTELQRSMTRLLIEWASLSNAMWEIKRELLDPLQV